KVKLAVGQVIEARRGVDALNPEGAKLPFAVLAADVSVAQGLFHLLDDLAPSAPFGIVVAFGDAECLFLPLARRDAAFDSSHKLPVREERLDDGCLGLTQISRLAHLPAAAGVHPRWKVTQAGLLVLHFAPGADARPVGGPAMG